MIFNSAMPKTSSCHVEFAAVIKAEPARKKPKHQRSDQENEHGNPHHNLSIIKWIFEIKC
jgi:hypothetical protein